MADIGIAVDSAQGSFLVDEIGRSYMDLTSGSGVLALGHSAPAVVAAMQAQVGSFVHGGWQLTSSARARLTEAVAALLPWPDPVLLFCTTGTEAVEGALKVARAATGRSQVLGFLGGYHGKTAGSLNVTANAAFRAGVTQVPVAGLSLPYPAAPGYLDPMAGSEPTDEMRTQYAYGREILDHPDFGAADVAGLIIEVVQGAGGMQAAAPGLLEELRQYTRERDMLLIVDEIFTGLGRTGRLFGIDHDAVIPDLMVLGKALGGGLPLSLVAGPREIMESIPALAQTSTFSANPVACAAGLAVLERLDDELLQDVVTRGIEINNAITSLDVPGISLRTTGRGLMMGIVVDDSTPTPGNATARVMRRMQHAGVLALRGGPRGNVIKLTPPLTLSRAECSRATDIVATALETEARR
ncbi:aspartate aminotransferase family protein [Mycobacteroides chelonae]|uniref:aspartate aminotransferase family protein n=1 Tax=Mycobacteroides chelonae TaxID=1774 RepID=UPI0012FF8A36|nr:aspartate aminotransferase family protein [Mycobacteroides chelonae]